VRFYYAVKANSNPRLIQAVLALGIEGCETVSLEEVAVCLRCGVEPGRIFHSPNFISRAELAQAVALKVQLNLGDR
jgi:diaminopimelate decarboxylase